MVMLILTAALSGCYTSFTHPGSNGNPDIDSSAYKGRRDESCVSCHVHRHPATMFWQEYYYNSTYPWYSSYFGYPWWWYCDEDNGDEDPTPSLPSVYGTKDREPFDWRKIEPPGRTGADSPAKVIKTDKHLKRSGEIKTDNNEAEGSPRNKSTRIKIRRSTANPDKLDEETPNSGTRTRQQSD